MSDIENKIEELRQQVDENLANRDSVCKNLGLFLMNGEGDENEEGLMLEYRNAALEINSRISLMDHQINEITEIEQTLNSFKEKDQSLKNRKKEAQENLSLLQETLGEELFHLVNTYDLDVPWKKAFEPLIKNITKIRDNETELYQAESQIVDKSLFKGLILKSKLSVLKGKKKTMENSQSKLYQKCFNDALLMGAGKGEDGDKDVELLTPWFRADKEWQSVLEEEQNLEEEKLRNKDRLKELCGGRGPGKRIEFLKKEQLLEEERLGDALKKWGESVTGDTPEALKSLPEVQKAIGEIDALTEDAIELNLNIEKWEARKDIEKLNKDQEYMNSRIESLEEEIQARRQEIKVLKKEITNAAKEIEKKRLFTGEANSEDN
ncbi:OmpH family outer membrane protein [Oceanispirochaeta crateris]|uniref:OmpH family outer membrane protein n=1 Tax=Oceanispirochaeta crateris TaxID=2518645 RepID=A0A5C1QPF0_9SPIO|nr:hypothetical protein [Oceanispirochaeta crateris]QEN08880.1 OmpH family outer membrane protein [Oceanispirochaeta crateris]